jgi:hypothetical protein
VVAFLCDDSLICGYCAIVKERAMRKIILAMLMLLPPSLAVAGEAEIRDELAAQGKEFFLAEGSPTWTIWPESSSAMKAVP